MFKVYVKKSPFTKVFDLPFIAKSQITSDEKIIFTSPLGVNEYIKTKNILAYKVDSEGNIFIVLNMGVNDVRENYKLNNYEKNFLVDNLRSKTHMEILEYLQYIENKLVNSKNELYSISYIKKLIASIDMIKEYLKIYE